MKNNSKKQQEAQLIMFDGEYLNVMGKFKIRQDKNKEYSIKDLTMVAFEFSAYIENEQNKKISDEKLVDILFFINFLQNNFKKIMELYGK